MFFGAFGLCILRLLKLKTEGQTNYRKPDRKVTKQKRKFSLILGKLNRALNNATKELSFKAWLNLYIRNTILDQSTRLFSMGYFLNACPKNLN